MSVRCLCFALDTLELVDLEIWLLGGGFRWLGTSRGGRLGTELEPLCDRSEGRSGVSLLRELCRELELDEKLEEAWGTESVVAG